MKDNLEYVIERKRNAQLEAVAMLIKRRIMGYLQRRKFLKIRQDIITIQKNYRVLQRAVFLSATYGSVGGGGGGGGGGALKSEDGGRDQRGLNVPHPITFTFGYRVFFNDPPSPFFLFVPFLLQIISQCCLILLGEPATLEIPLPDL